MKELTKEDLENVWLAIVRTGKGQRDKLPFVRRHFLSLQNVCRKHLEKRIDIYFSGVFVARKEAEKSRIVMIKEYQKRYQGQPHEMELRT